MGWSAGRRGGWVFSRRAMRSLISLLHHSFLGIHPRRCHLPRREEKTYASQGAAPFGKQKRARESPHQLSNLHHRPTAPPARPPPGGSKRSRICWKMVSSNCVCLCVCVCVCERGERPEARANDWGGKGGRGRVGSAVPHLLFLYSHLQVADAGPHVGRQFLELLRLGGQGVQEGLYSITGVCA